MTFEVASLSRAPPESALLPLALCPGRLPATDCIALLPHPVTSSRFHQWRVRERSLLPQFSSYRGPDSSLADLVLSTLEGTGPSSSGSASGPRLTTLC